MNYKRRPYRYTRRKYAGIKEHLVLPGVGAGISSLATLLYLTKTKGNIKEKLKSLVRNAALGAAVGGGLELGRVGINGISDALSDDTPIDGDPIADGHFLRYK